MYFVKVYYGMYIKCVHFNGTLNGSLFTQKKKETNRRLCVSPETSPGHSEMEARRDRREPHHKSQRSPKNRLPHRGPNGGDPGGGVRDELADALVMSKDQLVTQRLRSVELFKKNLATF